MKSWERKSRVVDTAGPNTLEILRILENDLKPAGTAAAKQRAARIIELSVDPTNGPPESPSDGLLYGLIQSGKTSVMTVAAAMAADNGFKCILVLTSDNDPLYEQTLERIRTGLRGLSVLRKNEWKDPERFGSKLRTPPFAVVCSKNGNVLQSLLDAFRAAGAKDLSVLIMDDEADQASLNTLTSKGTGEVSRINQVITEFRNYFPVNTYLQVTATPQALFLQRPDNRYRPSFSILTQPGTGYVGGDAFFGSGSSKLLRTVDLSELDRLRPSKQPSPSGDLPPGLRRSLYTFLVGASAKVIERPTDAFAFLCHVSMIKTDHDYIVKLIDSLKEECINAFQQPSSSKYHNVMKGLREAYDDLRETEGALPEFDRIIEKIKFYINGANIRLVNASSSDEIKLDGVFNLFVGGNKLGRGVTIRNLLVSYYGRNPKTPNADTVLQHARMYGYREKDLGVTRLFLPKALADHFASIHQMETVLRDFLEHFPDGSFEGIYVSGAWQPTRRNVLDPDALGYYVAGNNYNPPYPLRTPEVREDTAWLDSELSHIGDTEAAKEITIDRVFELITRCKADPKYQPKLWNLESLKAALEMLKKIMGNRAYLLVRRNRREKVSRRETQGILSGGDVDLIPNDTLTLFLFRQNATPSGEEEVWWPQLRFADGNYVLAFSFDW